MVVTKNSRDFPYVFLIPKMKRQWEAIEWCTQQFGKEWSVTDNREGTWCCFWRGCHIPGSYEWYFQNEKDAMLFSLRWV